MKRKTKKLIKPVVIDAGVHADLKAWCAKRGMKIGVAAGAFIAWAIGLAEEQTNVSSSALANSRVSSGVSKEIVADVQREKKDV